MEISPVVPANAGTHSHRPKFLRMVSHTARHREITRYGSPRSRGRRRQSTASLCLTPSAQRSQFTRNVRPGLPVVRLGKVGIGKDERAGREVTEHSGAAGAVVTVRHVSVLLPDCSRIRVVPRGLRAEDAEVDRDQDRPKAVMAFDLVRFGQTDKPAHLRTKILADVLLGQTRAEFLVVVPRGIVNDIEPPEAPG